eukprot:3300323-Amphidinium_carterae.1
MIATVLLPCTAGARAAQSRCRVLYFTFPRSVMSYGEPPELSDWIHRVHDCAICQYPDKAVAKVKLNGRSLGREYCALGADVAQGLALLP